ncbi:MAG: DsbE family thiol:disulfide interchange protein [Rhodocyclaceae bacterium]
MSRRALIPLCAFLALAALLGAGLRLNPRELPSALIDKPAPAFELPRLQGTGGTLSLADMRGKIWMLNVWASWCGACRQEHAALMAWSRRGQVPLVGLNYKDAHDEALAWLASHGDPYTISVVDEQGRTGIDFGVYGVPETFLIDQRGRIRYRHAGPLTPEVIEEQFVPRIEALQDA